MSTTRTKKPPPRSPAVPEEATIEVTNPATGAVLGEVAELEADGVAEIVARARAAQPGWSALGFDGRARVLHRFRRRLVHHRELVVETLQAEAGKPFEDANGDLMLVANWAAYWAESAAEHLADERIRSRSLFSVGRRNTLVHEPRGVIGVIAPWNFPLALGIGDALPALMAGNTVVVKPSEVTPLSSVLAAKLFLEAGGPADVLLVATGGGAAGQALVDEVDYLHFTGSVTTGRKVAAQAAARFTPYSFELGGKDAMVVLADADLERASAAAVHYGLFNTGQVCMSVERVYVEAPVYDRFVELVAGQVGALHQGVPTGPGSVDQSVLTNPPQLETVQRHVDDAVARGARVVMGGTVTTGPAAFFAPTVLADVDHTMACMQEETFGPTIPIMRVTDAEEAIERANDSEYGLTASVWTRDLGTGERVARRLEAGTVTVNDAMVHLGDPALPMGGWKSSGTGVRNGAAGIRRFTRQKVIQVPRVTASREPHWLPYREGATRMFDTLMGAIYGRPAPPRLTSSRPVQYLRDLRERSSLTDETR